MSQIIQVQVKSVYGAIKIYPVNEAAELIARIAGTKTISPQALECAKKLGLAIQEVPAYQLKVAA